MKLKYCGLHHADDVSAAAAGRSDYVGFVFAKSKRQVTRDSVAQWLASGQLGGKKAVALFVHEEPKVIAETVCGVAIDVIQCHGKENPETIQQVKEETGLPVWKAIHHSSDALSEMQRFDAVADGYVVDCNVADEWGGTGESFDWAHVPRYIEEGRRQGVPIFIAGGITPENIASLLAYDPDGIDVSSGIEKDGRKSLQRMRELESEMGMRA
ncbi:phosphoribosylanthranilate isomerase [Shouchella shacheensis]|uniref:phosphoribosylanthranilate isomerase n=1 Tax=Shouchella shacheensis TaxID=1649580 RepID=UPI0007405797|nr:phosphoribosylanthranilate isomerase [Shouchella shacheensis]